MKIHILMDATAGKAIGSRRGLGKVKHLDTIFLWVQEHVTSGRIAIGKIHTTMNFADILAKAVVGPLLIRLMEDLVSVSQKVEQSSASTLSGLSRLRPSGVMAQMRRISKIPLRTRQFVSEYSCGTWLCTRFLV